VDVKQMTVAELIEKLKAMPQDMPVQYLDYEQGETDVECVETDFDRYAGWKSFGGQNLQPAKATRVFIS
jgi:hypothetical protein